MRGSNGCTITARRLRVDRTSECHQTKRLRGILKLGFNERCESSLIVKGVTRNHLWRDDISKGFEYNETRRKANMKRTESLED